MSDLFFFMARKIVSPKVGDNRVSLTVVALYIYTRTQIRERGGMEKVSYYGISGDADFIYIGVGRLIEDMVALSPPIIQDDLRYYLEGRFGRVRGAIDLTHEELIEICQRFDLYAEALKDRKRRRVPAGVRRRVMERDGHECVACGATEDLALDHKHPFSRGGKHTQENLQVLCRSCNSRKHAKPLAEWEASLG